MAQGRRAALISAVAMVGGASAQEASPNAEAYLAFVEREHTAVAVDQTGYHPDAPKIAVVASDAEAPLPFELRGADGEVVLSGETEPGEGVHQADLTAAPAGGPYVLTVDGAGDSHPFEVGADLYRPLARDALLYFYHNRAGVPVEADHVGDAHARPAGHAEETATCFSGDDQNGVSWPACDYELEVAGGWYDAGDHGKYLVNSGISTFTLLDMADRGFARNADAAGLPESGNGVPDALDEARVNLAFMLAMQAPKGARAAIVRGRRERGEALEPKMADVSGMAHHKVADENWTALPTAPHEDRETRYLYPPSTAATLSLAAVAAHGSRSFAEVDGAFAARCLEAARRAYDAARRVPDAYAYANFTGSGGYGDGNLEDEWYWAAAELYAATGERRYRRDAERYRKKLGGDPADGPPSWANVELLGTMTLAAAAPR